MALCRQLHNCAVVRSLLKSYAIFVIPALSNSLWCSSIDPLSATAQLCSPAISPEVVRDFRNPSFAQTCLNPNASKAMVMHQSIPSANIPPGNPRGFAPIFILGPRDLCRLDCPGVGPIIKVPSCQLMLHEGTFQLQTDLPSVDAL